ncbi:hypothetical protein BpHYR1_001877 [Brachionus plicatilis]|uniref:Uncharacterized protein n=1 Tax=Brachionus plicatilis TaxID=10195 RepID=A0A3M7Q2Q3_BRAPC|nr:hypothetical protein BpHYR1_001877 [Brachionus plicatilis]
MDRKLMVVDFKVGDIVILKWKRARKSCSLFDPNPFKVIKIEGYQGNETLELTLTDTDEGGGDEVVQIEAVTGTEDEGKNDFETSEEGGLNDQAGSNVLQRQNSGMSDEVVSVEGRPTRVVKKPDRYGQPVEYGTRPYVRRNSNQNEEE